ncbi:peroxiredoxin family protein [Odoribacter laneus]|uniref:peroxiredoxin family protein n=1 Tax=Odoribacter laneus TaxID=626933 RepID=UPI0023EFBE40|nr:TlpA disulfide reductase family protein [Odoribacter laneus]
MKKVIFVLLFAAISGMTFAQKAETLVKTGMTVPDFEVKMFDGQTVQMKDLRGKVVLLNFWATWCPDCIRELARVQTGIIDRFQGKDFVFLPISRQDSYEKIKAFREKRGHTFPMGMDPDRKIYAQFATAIIPRNFIIDRDGKILYAGEGDDETSFQKLILEIEKALKTPASLKSE